MSYLTSKDAKKGGNNSEKGGNNIKKVVKAVRCSNYLTLDAKKGFNHIWHIFTQVPILQHFDPERHIWIETNALGYTIAGVLSQLILDNLGRWHPIAYYSCKIILAKTQYKIHNRKFFAIVEAFKIWRHNLKDYKYKVLVFTNHNNFCRFIDIKNLSSCQAWWAQELFCYYFWIDYCQSKANKTVNALSYSFQRNKDEEKKF